MDVDDWAKEDCICGHRRHQHALNDGACRHTKMRRVPPEGIIWTGEAFDAEPSIPYDQWPEVVEPCCPAFHEAGLAMAESEPW